MKKGLLIAGGVVAMFVVLAICFVMWVVSIFNGEIILRNRYEAQSNMVETSMDNMRKTIMNQFKVSSEFADKFIKVVEAQADGRKGGGLMKSSTEANTLGITPELYGRILNTIEGKLAEFKRSQDVLTDIWQQHKTYCEWPVHTLFIGGRNNIPKPEMITSAASKEAMATKKLNDNLLED